MDLYELWAMALAIIGSIFSMGSVLCWKIAKLDSDIKGACTRLDGHAARIDHLYQVTAQRTDELHRMFYELLKEIRK